MPRPERKYHKRFEPVDGNLERTHPLYSTWANMLERCYFEKSPAFENYGGRGIKVCEDWWHFKNFVRDMGGKPNKTASLNRINNDGNYCLENCEWADRTMQNLNRRVFKTNKTNHSGVIAIGNSFEARIDYKKVRYRLGRFTSLEAAISARDKAKNEIAEGRLPTLPDETIWNTSTTKLRGITPHKDGGFVVRKTIDGERKYLGYFKTLEAAINAKFSRN